MINLKEILFIILLLTIVVGSMIDLLTDYAHHASRWHLLVEACIILFSISGLTYLLREIWERKRENQKLKNKLSVAQKDLSATQARLKEAGKQYSHIIQEQFGEWQLTTSECEVALLLLKGLSFKEIAEIRETLEKTVRQQASSVYKKSGIPGRHEFAAYFFEDFLY